MTKSITSSSIQISNIKARSLFPDVLVTLTAAALLAASIGARAQAAESSPTTAPAAAQTGTLPAAATAAVPATPDTKPSKKKKMLLIRTPKNDEKVVVSKDTKQADKKAKKVDPLVGKDANLPDKVLYDKAEAAVKRGRYDVARLDLQTLLNAYPDSQYMMRAKLGVADSWYKEGGVAALTQAEQEYTDFITFFPNAPEAAEAQMRIGDIYFKQMDKPDRDYANTLKAEAAYRQMIQQFPDSTLLPQAKQRLREVQETLASREANIASFYATHQNWSATIARYQTVVDTYPLYSHLDDVLLGLGDSFEAEAQGVRASKLPEAAKAQLLKIDEDQAAAAYRKIVLEHSAAAHVEDAKDRLVAMGLPIPTPTPEQAAASAALENSRGQYTLSSRVELFVLHKADTVPAASVGEPPLEDATPTLAPDVYKKAMSEYYSAMNPAAYPPRTAAATTPSAPSQPASDAAVPAPSVSSAPLTLQNVPTGTAGAENGSSAVVTNVPDATTATSSGRTSMGIEIVQHSANSPAPGPAPAAPPAFPGSETSAPAQSAAAAAATQVDDNGGLKPVGPTGNTALPPIEKPAAAPDAINEVTPGSQPPAQTAPANGKKPKPAFIKAEESSSKHKKKKGLAKLNPF